MQVFAKCDDFMSTLMAKLGHDIPPFTLKRRARVAIETKEGGQVCVSVTGLDRDEDLPYSFIKVSMQQHTQCLSALATSIESFVRASMY